MRRVDHQVQQFVHRGVDVQHVHARARHHDVTGAHIGHADYTFQHGAAVGTDDLVVFGLGQGFDQLGAAVGAGVQELGQFLQKTAFILAHWRGQRRGAGIGHCKGPLLAVVKRALGYRQLGAHQAKQAPAAPQRREPVNCQFL